MQRNVSKSLWDVASDLKNLRSLLMSYTSGGCHLLYYVRLNKGTAGLNWMGTLSILNVCYKD